MWRKTVMIVKFAAFLHNIFWSCYSYKIIMSFKSSLFIAGFAMFYNIHYGGSLNPKRRTFPVAGSDRGRLIFTPEENHTRVCLEAKLKSGSRSGCLVKVEN
ncbi:hypothetical protein XENOCAPTIV_001959 [Xenoophorus captivus]|uniref:Secreted protein n=1 Tax=Xenoophorus captivus TaxID=1517983 RepID=A0ABV0RGH5_9TELE